ncbi:E3 ubiquitin-protein ligase Bre1, partial [Operophtera brumata]
MNLLGGTMVDYAELTQVNGNKFHNQLLRVTMSKRSTEDSGNGTSQPPIKKVHFEPHLIGPVSTLEEMDIKVLQFQNKKLAQRIEQRHRCEAELRARIEQLEKRQTQDDAVLCVVNRYWNLLNEDIRVLLQRFDAETADESENKNENEATTSFLMQLSTWDKEELDAQLANRVQVSKRAVAKVVRATNEEVTAENRRLQALCTRLHEAHHEMTLRVAHLQDAVNSRDTENAELKNQIDDLQYELLKIRSRNDKLENHLAEAIEKLKSLHQSGASAVVACPAVASAHAHAGGAVAAAKLEDVAAELEEQRELANNRLAELDRLHRQHRDTLKEVEKLKMDSEELSRQKALRAEMIQLEDVLGQLRKEYEMLRIEFEQNLAANEQTGPINREMRHLITSLQNHNQQLKGEVHRYKRKYKDTSQELNKKGSERTKRAETPSGHVQGSEQGAARQSAADGGREEGAPGARRPPTEGQDGADEDALRKIKQLEEQKYELQKQLSCVRPNASDPLHGFSRPFTGSQEEEALLNEMEVTGQAFEDMQEQNSRLIQQLREKDDANFKL